MGMRKVVLMHCLHSQGLLCARLIPRRAMVSSLAPASVSRSLPTRVLDMTYPTISTLLRHLRKEGLVEFALGIKLLLELLEPALWELLAVCVVGGEAIVVVL